jgi:DNA-binding LacI/PurR family transcriptional regulator/DNA-binding CsgD family transcriptional regulator
MLDGAEVAGVALLFFQGSAIGSPWPGHADDNSVYRLCNPEHLDGMIFPADAVGNFTTGEQTGSLVNSFSPIPVLTLGMDLPDIPDISCDNYGGMKECLTHLLDHHHAARIGFIRGPSGNREANDRWRAFSDTLTRSGLSPGPELVFRNDFSTQGCPDLAEALLKPGILPLDALVCSNDETALTLARLLRARGIRIPGDLMLTGFDDYPAAYLSTPALTTVHQPIYEIGFQAVTRLAAAIRGEPIPLRSTVPTRLMIRESCGCGDKTTGKRIFYQAAVPDSPSPADPAPPDRQLAVQRDTLIKTLLDADTVPPVHRGEMEKALTDMLDILVFDLRQYRPQPMVLTVFSEWLDNTLGWNSAGEMWQKILFTLHDRVPGDPRDLRFRDWLGDLFLQLFGLLAQKIQFRESQNFHHLQQFISDLENAMDMVQAQKESRSLLETLGRGISLLGTGFFALMLLENYPLKAPDLSAGNLVTAALTNGRDGRRITSDQAGPFPVSTILPPGLDGDAIPLRLLVREIHRQGRHYGYLVMELDRAEPFSYGLIHNQVSGALDSVYRFSQVSERAQTAETLPVPVTVTDRDLHRLWSNKAFLELYPSAETETLFDDRSSGLIRQWLENPEIPPPVDLQMKDPRSGKICPVLAVDLLPTPEIRIRFTLMDPVRLLGNRVLDLKSFFHIHRITPREGEIIELLLQGYRIKDTADKLFVAESTIKSHVADLYRKLGVSTRSGLIDLVNSYFSGSLGTNGYIYSLLGRLLGS